MKFRQISTPQPMGAGALQRESIRGRTARVRELSVVGLFAGIGGLEQGFREAGHNSLMLCEADPVASTVLRQQFPEVKLTTDVRNLRTLPTCDVITAGFPCQDLSQVGKRRGISGPDSGLIGPVLALLRKRRNRPSWLVLENVPFMLKLHRGRAIAAIVGALESAGWAWAYRIVDTLSFGLPQRRRRVILLASPSLDPRPALLAEDAGEPELVTRKDHACGFYWTEGNTGLGWANNAIPPLKGGSALHIPSPPAIWFPRRRAMSIPDIRDAERLQGFDANWTLAAADQGIGNRKRWRLIGNAVSVPVSAWLAGRLNTQSVYDSHFDDELRDDEAWPDAAWGINGTRASADSSQWPRRCPTENLATFLRYQPDSLTAKATAGFLSRLERSTLRYNPTFAEDLHYHLKHAKRIVR